MWQSCAQNKKDLETLLQLFWKTATALVIEAFSPPKLQFKSILGSKWRDWGLVFIPQTPSNSQKDKDPLYLWHFRANFSTGRIRKSCGNLNLQADLYLPVILSELLPGKESQHDCKGDDQKAQEALAVLLAMNQWKSPLDCIIPRVRLLVKSPALHRIIYQSYPVLASLLKTTCFS